MIDPYSKSMAVIAVFGLLIASISPIARKRPHVEEWFFRVSAFCMVLAFVLFVLSVVNS